MSDIITNLLLDNVTSHKILLAKELNGADSSFITSCLLGHCIKIKSPVLVICLHNSKEHYQNVGLKMNYNLMKNIDSGFIHFYNLGEELVNGILDNGRISTNDVIDKLKKQIEIMHETHYCVNVIFEGVSHLFDMEYSLRDVNNICKEIIDIVRAYDNSYLLFHCNAACDNDETHVLANLLIYKCHVAVEVDHLASGLSADVSGHITFKYPSRKFEKKHMYNIYPKRSHHLFKLFDRGVKFLASGVL